MCSAVSTCIYTAIQTESCSLFQSLDNYMDHTLMRMLTLSRHFLQFFPSFCSAAWLLTGFNRHQRITPVLASLHWFKLLSHLSVLICLYFQSCHMTDMWLCQPLEYHSVMSKHRLITLVCFSWLMPFSL